MTEKCEEIERDKKSTGYFNINAITRITSPKLVHQIRWTIQNFSEIALDSKISGPDFHFTPMCLASVAFKRNTDNLYVYVINKSDVKIQMVRKIFLFDYNDKKLHEDIDAKVFTIGKDCEVDILGSVNDRTRFNVLPNNTLVIDLSISMKGEITTEMCCPYQFLDPQKKLIEDIKLMQENSINSDIFLQVGDERISAHWSILCSRSPYFKKMFDSKMLECLQNTVTITDISLANLKKLIKFLYSAEFVDSENDNLEELFNLYYAADKYEVLDLRALCGSKIMSKFTTDNICQIFELAHRHNDESLKRQAMNYIHFHSDAVFLTDGWKEFEARSFEPIAADLFRSILKKTEVK